MADVKIYDDISVPEQVEEITEKIDDIKTDDVKEDIKDIEEKVDDKLEEIRAEKTELNEERVIFETKKALEEMKNEIIDVNTAIENASENEKLDSETEEKPKKVNPFLIGAVALGAIAVAWLMCKPKEKDEGGTEYGY